MNEEIRSADGPVATVQRYVDAFNDGDVDAMVACFTATGSILDGMAPHVWCGASAARDWYGDVLAEGRHVGAGDYRVTLGSPRHANITGDAAYVVSPATMTFTLRGKPVTQSDATFTTALERDGGRWRIASWAWSKGQAAT